MIIALCSFFVLVSPAQRPDMIFDHYSVEDGLSQSTVLNIFEDSRGFIWFCTPDGLNKFDGYSFTVYRNIKGDTNSISGNHPVFIFEDSNGDLWIGQRAGLSKYHYRQERFSTVYQLPKINSEYEGLIPLHEAEGKIWAWDKRRGIVGFNRTTLKEEVIYPAPDKYSKSMQAYSRYGKTINGRAFISTTSNLMIVFDFRTLHYTFLFNKTFDPNYTGVSATNKFTIDKDNNIWIPARDGLIYLDTKTLESKIYKGGFNGAVLTSGAFDSNGMLWLGSITNGLYFMDIKTGVITNISKENHKEKGLLYNYIESLFLDSSDNMWIGTNGFGIQKFSKHRNFDLFDLKIGTNEFGGNLVKSIAEDDKGNLYVGTHGNGLYAINREGDIKNFKLPQDNHATALVIYSNGDVLISNNYKLFTLHNDKIAPLQIKNKKTPLYITGLVQISDHEVLVTSTTGVLSLKKESSAYLMDSKWPTISGIATVPFKDSKGRIWIGMQRSFYLLDASDAVPRLMEHVTKNYVKSFSEDEFGNVWIATLGELVCFNPETGKTDILDEKNGFVNTFFYAALEDNDHKIWVSSNQGLACYDPLTKKIKNYTVLDGLQGNEFNTGAYHKLRDGRLAFGGINGLNLFDPTAIRENPNRLRVAFTNFMVDDKPYKLDTSIVYKKKIDLTYSNNTFSFEFSGLEYTSPENIQYRYILEGQDKDWVQGGNRRFVRYSRLSPGQYTFKVKASYDKDLWNGEPAVVVVTIQPPLYMQKWFIALLVVLVILVVVLISAWIVRTRYRSRLRQLEVNHEIQLERGRISRDLHDHVGSQLTFIINQLEDNHQQILSKERLSDVRETARMAMSNFRETIWALHRESITLVDFTDLVKEFAIKQLKSKNDMRLNFDEKFTADHVFNPSKALNLFRILQEAINNVVKHSDASMLTITIAQVNDCLQLMITDNGKGFMVNPSKHSGYGLQNITFRANEMDAVLSISSTPGQGTQITIDLPLHHEIR